MPTFSFNLKELTISNWSSTLTIEGISFTVSSPERTVSILGESGMGKTSIFKSLFSKYVVLWSMEKKFRFSCLHSYNETEFDDQAIKRNMAPGKIGFATQFPYFFGSETVRENLFAPLKWKRLSWSEEKKEEYIKLFCLEELVNKQMAILSGGQVQLINIARMLVLGPDIAIIDECFSSMDEEMSQKYIDIVKTNFCNCIFLLTSHRRSDVMRFGGQIIQLRKERYKSGRYYISQQTIEGVSRE